MDSNNLRKLIINRLERKHGRGNIDLFSIEDVSDLSGKYSGIDWVVHFKVRRKRASEMHVISAGCFRNNNDGPDLVKDFIVKDVTLHGCPMLGSGSRISSPRSVMQGPAMAAVHSQHAR